MREFTDRKMQLFLSAILLCLTGVYAQSCGNWTFASIDSATHLSTTEIQLQLRYYHEPGQQLVIVVQDIDTIRINSNIAQESSAYYEYVYQLSMSSMSTYCFTVVRIDSLCGTLPVNDTVVCASNSETNSQVTYFDHNLSSGDPRQVSFNWVVDSPTDVLIYCTRQDSPFIHFQQEYNIGVVEAAVSGFEPGTTYNCRASSRDRSETAGISRSVTFTTYLPAPHTLSANATGPTTITVSWQYNYPAVYYTVYTSDCLVNNTVSLSTTNTPFIIPDLTPFNLYCIYVRATAAGGTSLQSTTVVVRTQEAAPEPVMNLMATGTSSISILVNWEEPLVTNGVITEYLVEVNGAPQSVDGNPTSVNIEGLDPCVDHTFRVAASTGAGMGAWTTTVFGQTLNPIPAAPEIQTVNRDGGTLDIRWSTDTPFSCVESIVVHFQPVYSLEDPEVLNLTSITQPLFLSVQLQDMVAYNITMRLYGPGGTSEPSTPILLTPDVSNASSYEPEDRTQYTQVQLVGVGNCIEWQNANFPQDIAEALQHRLSFLCPQVTNNVINSTLMCVGTNKALFRSQRSVSEEQFHRCLEAWYTSLSPVLQVADRVLYIDTTCDQLYIQSLLDGACIPLASEPCSNAASVAGGLIGGLLIGALLAACLVIVIFLICFRRKLFQPNTTKRVVGSCTVLNTIEPTTYTATPQKKPQKVNTLQKEPPKEDDNYEMLPFPEANKEEEGCYVDMKSPTAKPKTLKTHKSHDSDYEVPDLFIKDRQKAIAAANKPSTPQYENISDSVQKAKTLPGHQSRQATADNHKLPKADSAGDVRKVTQVTDAGQQPILPPGAKADTSWVGPTKKLLQSTLSEGASKKPLVPTMTNVDSRIDLKASYETTVTADRGKVTKKVAAAQPHKVLSKMPALPSKDTPPAVAAGQEEEGKKKRPLFPMAKNKDPPPTQPKKTDKKSGISAKAKMFGTVFTGQQPPKPKPKPKGKDTTNIQCSGNSAYEPWQHGKK